MNDAFSSDAPALADGSRLKESHSSLAAAAAVADSSIYSFRRLPAYAVPLFVRVVDELNHTSTFKNRKVELRSAAYDPDADGELHALAGREAGYVPAYPGYAADVASGKAPIV
ncbi:hypothetical protein [Nocardia sp. NPDC004750]